MRRIVWILLAPLLRLLRDVAALLSPPAPPSWQQDFVETDGRKRSFVLIVPQRRLPGLRFPIVLALHGGQGNPRRIARMTRLGERVESDGFIAVFPDAGGRPWNDGRETTRFGLDDVAFLLAIIRRVADAHDGDPKRAFVMGISNGGMMVQRLACEAGGAFKAYAAVAANLPAALARGARPSQPVPIVLFSGTADQLMPFAGGELGKGRAGRGAGGHVISAPDTVRFWAELNGCRNESVVALPDKENDGTQVLLHSFEGCRPGGEVEFYEIVGGGHTWPGGTAPKHPALRRLLGNVSADIDATAIALDFFRRHGL